MTISHVDLSGNEITDECAGKLFVAAMKNGVETLVLRDNPIAATGDASIALKNLVRLGKLKHLDLCRTVDQIPKTAMHPL